MDRPLTDEERHQLGWALYCAASMEIDVAVENSAFKSSASAFVALADRLNVREEFDRYHKPLCERLALKGFRIDEDGKAVPLQS